MIRNSTTAPTFAEITPDRLIQLTAERLPAPIAALFTRGAPPEDRAVVHRMAEREIQQAALDRASARGELPPAGAAARARKQDVERWPFGTDIDWSAAVSAFNGTSHVPEQRAARVIYEYADHMLKMRERLGEDFETYRAGYLPKLRSWLSAHSGVLSTMIAGRSGFNVRQAEKRGATADNRAADLRAFHEGFFRRRSREAKRAARLEARQGGGVVEDLRREIANLAQMQEQMKATNAAIRKAKVIPADDEGRTRLAAEIAAKVGLKPTTVLGVLTKDFAGRIGFPDYIMSGNLANIKRKRERLADEEAKAERAAAGGEDYARTVQTPNGPVDVVYNREDDRIQITARKGVIDSALLKEAALHWTPSLGVHQRQLTDRAIHAISYMLERAGVKLDPPLPWLKQSMGARPAPADDPDAPLTADEEAAADAEADAELAEIGRVVPDEAQPEPEPEPEPEPDQRPASALFLQLDRLGLPGGMIVPTTYRGKITAQEGRLYARLTGIREDYYGELGVSLRLPLYASPDDPEPVRVARGSRMEREAVVLDVPGRPDWFRLRVDPQAAHPSDYFYQNVIPADQEDEVRGFFAGYNGKRKMSDDQMDKRSGEFITGYLQGRRERKEREDKQKAAKNDSAEDDHRRNGAPALRVQTGRALGPDRAFSVDFDPPGDDGYTRARMTEGGAPWRVPTVSVRRWTEDLNARLVDVPRGLDRRVDEVLDGRARFAGKGNDGLVWITPSGWAVKADTVVLYQPQNDGQRTPEQAARHLEHEANVHRALADLPMVPRCDVVRTPGGRVLLIKPALDTAPVLDRSDLLAVEATVKAIHERGWIIGDRVQVGRAPDGRLYIFDLGSARRGDTAYEREGDKDYLERLWRDAGFQRPDDPDHSAKQAEFYTRMVLGRLNKGERPPDSVLRGWREHTTAHGANLSGSDFDAYMLHADRMEAIEDRLRALPAG